MAESLADLVPCDLPTFASLNGGVLTLDCPPSRQPLYSIGLDPTLLKYEGATRLPNGTEFVLAYCRFATHRGAACERLGRERKKSNAAALRRQCPPLSHGWVLDVAVAPVVRPQLAGRARERRERWRQQLRQRQAAARGAEMVRGVGVGVGTRVEAVAGRKRSVPDEDVGTSTHAGGMRDLNVIVIMLDSIALERFRQERESPLPRDCFSQMESMSCMHFRALPLECLQTCVT